MQQHAGLSVGRLLLYLGQNVLAQLCIPPALLRAGKAHRLPVIRVVLQRKRSGSKQLRLCVWVVYRGQARLLQPA